MTNIKLCTRFYTKKHSHHNILQGGFMKRNEVVEYFLSKPFAVETYPFDDVTAVFKIGGKMFALISSHESDRLSINLKNKPDENILMRQIYEDVIPGYHMNKTIYRNARI